MARYMEIKSTFVWGVDSSLFILSSVGKHFSEADIRHFIRPFSLCSNFENPPPPAVWWVQKIMGPALKSVHRKIKAPVWSLKQRARYAGWSSFLKKSENHQKFRTVWSAGVERLILGLSDQQLVTSIAILFAVYLRVYSISVYDFQTASTLAWFSSTTHLATITILPRYLDKHKPVRNIRAFLMILFAVLLASTQILSYSKSLTGSAWNSYLGCVLTTEFRMSPR